MSRINRKNKTNEKYIHVTISQSKHKDRIGTVGNTLLGAYSGLTSDIALGPAVDHNHSGIRSD